MRCMSLDWILGQKNKECFFETFVYELCTNYCYITNHSKTQ